ncbi:NUDIX domain-containing protein [Sphingomonas glacialis]|uniref:NUDIX domain-containing protein n=1 Tax=Sphingomonas glacialis TaxID=658225 RepID=A0A502FPZ1_9SPHN|nr:NUDIX domain-containing protein [Sphingomonas glacialis]TPG51618.1 NUDIX domain-containing protein [Sphingomonas glacialis]
MTVILKRDALIEGWVNVTRVEMLLADGAIVERHVEDHGAGAVVLPYDPIRKVALLIRQPRAAVLISGDEPPLEAIAGRLDGLDPETCARREALEEGGVALLELESVVHLWSMPSISTERLHLFLAPYDTAMRVGPGGGCAEEHENIVAYEIPLAQLAVDAAAGRLTDAKTLILVQALQLRHAGAF